jgi:CHAD domain-containing protein
LRRAAGDARDWDVFSEMLADWSRKRPSADAPGLDFLRGYGFAERRRAQDELIEARTKGFDADEVIGALGEPADFTAPRHFGEIAGPLVDNLLDDLDRGIANDTGDYDHLHQIRICGKRLRYAMEIVADCFSPPFREELYPAVEAMQEILGDANDSHVAAGRIAEIRERLKQARRDDWRRCRAGLDRLLKSHQKKLPQARKKFAAWLKGWRKLRGEFNTLTRLPQTATPA